LVGASSADAKIKPAAQFEHYYFTIGAALSGLGACVVPWHLVADEVTGGRLVAPFGFRETGYRYILRGSRPADRKSARFSAWLREEAAAQIVPA
jgi:DNA-binding transcriptional LysR family regulator